MKLSRVSSMRSMLGPKDACDSSGRSWVVE